VPGARRRPTKSAKLQNNNGTHKGPARTRRAGPFRLPTAETFGQPGLLDHSHRKTGDGLVGVGLIHLMNTAPLLMDNECYPRLRACLRRGVRWQASTIRLCLRAKTQAHSCKRRRADGRIQLQHH
jgi:hypothetical protein